MTSHLFPPPHSCDFCQSLTLYKRDEKGWKKAIESSSDDSDDFGVRLSDRVKQWLFNRLEAEVKAWEKSEMPKSFRYSLLRSFRCLRNIVIFDCTIAEARDAAAKRCSLCSFIIGDYRHESEDDLFLAASISEDHVFFGAIEVELTKPRSKAESFEANEEAERIVDELRKSGEFFHLAASKYETTPLITKYSSISRYSLLGLTFCSDGGVERNIHNRQQEKAS
jgi:hypothetical protein